MADDSSTVSTAVVDHPFPVVALGASAGGLKAFETFFKALATDTGMAFILVQHLSPDQPSDLAEILKRYTALPVVQVSETVALEPNHVYVIPPNKGLRVQQARLHLHAPAADRHPPVAVDDLFCSLATDLQSRAVAIILSGTGNDGVQGLIEIHNQGGFTMAQDPAEAQYASMPEHAIDTGLVDLVAPAAQLAKHLADGSLQPRQAIPDDEASAAVARERESSYLAIINRLFEATGRDFSLYKRPTMLRRLARRLEANQLTSLAAYEAYLSEHPEEGELLIKDLLIKVTEFFRDPEAFTSLEKNVIPRLLDMGSAEAPIRIWVAGCATGEEAYSIAMLLHEESVRRHIPWDFKIFATDLDELAVETARRGVFSEEACANLSLERRQRFFIKEGGYRIQPFIRDRILFAVHDLLKDPPFANLQLATCRNLLIYLEPDAQRRAFEALHYSLKLGGYLFIGQSEYIGMARDLFTPLDDAHRIYQSRPAPKRIAPRATWPTRSDENEGFEAGIGRRRSTGVEWGPLHHAMLSRAYSPPSLLVNGQGAIVHITGDVRPYMHIPEGSPTTAVISTVHPDLRVKLRTALTIAFGQNSPTKTGSLTLDDDGRTRAVRLIVRPINAESCGEDRLALITFEAEDNPPSSTEELTLIDTSSQTDLDRLEEELGNVRRELEARIESQEIITERLTTSNEELMTINEELQSTTEELETSKEELQSTNEELTTVNEELNHKVTELDNLNSDLKNLLSSTPIGTIFLDPPLCIKRYTEPVTRLFNILDSDLGRPLEHITHELNYDALLHDVRLVLETLEPIEREVISRSGRWYIMRASPYKTLKEEVKGVVLTFFDTTDRHEALSRMVESELLFRTVFESASDAMFVFAAPDDGPLLLENVNAGAVEQLKYPQGELLTLNLADFTVPTSVDLDTFLATLREQGEVTSQMKFLDREGNHLEVEVKARQLTVSKHPKVILVSRDITAQKAYEEGLLAAKSASDRLADMRASFLANMSHEIRTPLTSIIGVSQLLARHDLSEKQRVMVGLIQTSGKRLHETLDSVLDISRIEAGEMKPHLEPTHVVEEINEDIDILRPLADRKGLELHFRHELDEDTLFYTDIGFIHRIVYNLVQNSIKFTDEGEVEVVIEAIDGALQLTVRDTGMGIEEAFLPHIFDKFKQASEGHLRRFDGSGLGLALVKHLVDILEGTIVIDSTLGEGTTITVVIPEHLPDESTTGER